MNTDTLPLNPPASDEIPPDVRADLDAIARALATGEPIDPELARRARERSARATAETLRRNGVMNIAVDLIREGRDEE